MQHKIVRAFRLGSLETDENTDLPFFLTVFTLLYSESRNYCNRHDNPNLQMTPNSALAQVRSNGQRPLHFQLLLDMHLCHRTLLY